MVTLLAAILRIYIQEWLPLSSKILHAKFGYKRLSGLGGVSGRTDGQSHGQNKKHAPLFQKNKLKRTLYSY